jgi:predicted phage terminase large subunit-like protein
MNQNVAVKLRRPSIEKFGKLLAEHKRRQTKKLQSQRGWYDEDGVRQGGLIAFVRYFWHVVEPETPFGDGWPIWSMIEHLEAVSFGEITRLLMNVPPGFMKSLLVDVFWPAWEWGPLNRAHLRYVAFSYSASLTERDNKRFSDIVTSEAYQELYGDHVKIGLTGVTKITNEKKGWKLASSVGGVATGERGDRVILDDPHNIIEGESEIERNKTTRWFRESMSNRMNDMRVGAIVIIMQRVHEDDVSGVVLEQGLDYCHLMIPMEFEPRASVTNVLGWTDPRDDVDNPDAAEGELAWPERFPPKVWNFMKRDIGPYAVSSQYQQSPVPRGGGIFKREWWQSWECKTLNFGIEFEFLLASLDSAFTDKEQNDPSALTIWGVFVHPESGKKRVMLVGAWRKHLQFSGPRIARKIGESDVGYRQRTMEHWGLIEWVRDSCRKFKVDKLLIEAKASGISAAQELQNRYGREGYAVQLCPVSGDKVARALAVQATFANLIVYAPAFEWSDMFVDFAELVIDEMAVFPKGRYKDLTDSATQAIKSMRDWGLLQTDEEVTATENERVTHRPRQTAVYPV